MSEHRRPVTAAAATRSGGAADEAARAARVRRTAWLLGLLAAFFYVGFIAWNLLRSSLGI